MIPYRLLPQHSSDSANSAIRTQVRRHATGLCLTFESAYTVIECLMACSHSVCLLGRQLAVSAEKYVCSRFRAQFADPHPILVR
jgi:hypothetical protein